jgi:hypothetical protein
VDEQMSGMLINRESAMCLMKRGNERETFYNLISYILIYTDNTLFEKILPQN